MELRSLSRILAAAICSSRGSSELLNAKSEQLLSWADEQHQILAEKGAAESEMLAMLLWNGWQPLHLSGPVGGAVAFRLQQSQLTAERRLALQLVVQELSCRFAMSQLFIEQRFWSNLLFELGLTDFSQPVHS